ncbi:MAG: hypothetical protein SF182_13765 [Deltaproteobacteria bacterium]|nr:hypothetical protein [Deltaproteobacteria bacterium]
MRDRSGRRGRWEIACGVCLAALSLAGCAMEPTTLAPIDAPIVLNDNPFLGAPGDFARSAAGTYKGQHSEEASGGGYVTTQTKTHSAQINAAQALGGQPDRAIVHLNYDVTDLYALFYVFIGTEMHGDVVEYAPAAAQP